MDVFSSSFSFFYFFFFFNSSKNTARITTPKRVYVYISIYILYVYDTYGKGRVAEKFPRRVKVLLICSAVSLSFSFSHSLTLCILYIYIRSCPRVSSIFTHTHARTRAKGPFTIIPDPSPGDRTTANRHPKNPSAQPARTVYTYRRAFRCRIFHRVGQFPFPGLNPTSPNVPPTNPCHLTTRNCNCDPCTHITLAMTDYICLMLYYYCYYYYTFVPIHTQYSNRFYYILFCSVERG